MPGAFTFSNPPSVDAIVPQAGPPAAATPFTITGQDFQDGVTILFGTTPATDVVFVSDTTLTGLTPALPAGVVDVTVTNPDGQQSLQAGGYRYTDADLQLARFLAPAGVGVGEAFTVTDTTKNLRTGATPPTTTAFFIQPDGAGPMTPGLNAPAIAIGQRVVPAFAGRGANAATTSVTVPPGTPPGVYRLYAQTDFDLAVRERSEANNMKQRRLLVGGDLLALPVRAPLGAARGDLVTATVRTKNIGPGTAPPGTMTRLYLSADGTIDDGVDRLVVEWTLEAIAPGEIVLRSHEFEVPPALAPGRYYLIARVDWSNTWAELNETNNTKAKGFTVR